MRRYNPDTDTSGSRNGDHSEGADSDSDGGKNVLKTSQPTPADLDRSILLEWRASSLQLQQVWSDDNAPMSAWEGVTVGAAGCVVGIELYQKQLTSVPAALGNLAALKKLYLHFNTLTHVPKELGNLAALELLHLGANQLQSLPAELGNLAELKELWASNNKLESVPKELGGLTKLKKLYLGGAVQINNIKTRVESALDFSA